jgi:hypothetical protein
MNPSREEALFAQAVEKPAAERAAFLDRECSGDAELRQRVESLLQAHERSGEFLNQSPAELPAKTFVITTAMVTGTETPGTETPGTVIGRYKILEEVGEGGFGVVYVAEQREPVKRRVALKIIKLGMDTKQVVDCFEAERQALAMMDHPNIAKVLDAGATQAGRPYFVMNWCAASASRITATKTIFPHANASISSSKSAGPSSTRIKRGSSIAISSHRTSWSPSTTACPCPRSLTSASPRRRRAS